MLLVCLVCIPYHDFGNVAGVQEFTPPLGNTAGRASLVCCPLNVGSGKAVVVFIISQDLVGYCIASLASEYVYVYIH